MSPRSQNLDDVQSADAEPAVKPLSDMRRVSLSLIFNPARQRRRIRMDHLSNRAGKWFRLERTLRG